MEEKQMVDQALTPEAIGNQQSENVENQNLTEKSYTKEQVVDLMKQRIDRSHNSMFKRYNVSSFEELDEICKNYREYQEWMKTNNFNSREDILQVVQDYNSQKEGFGKLTAQNSDLLRENAFLKNNVNPEKYQDIIAHFKGNEMEFSEEELVKALATHPEWLKQQPIRSVLKAQLGTNGRTEKPPKTEAEIIKEMFG